MKKAVKKVVLLLTIFLWFVTVEERIETQAAMNQQVDKTVSGMALLECGKMSESNAKICSFDDRKISASGLVNSNLTILHKRNTPTPTPASKKSSEEEEDNYGLGGFVILVILAVLWFRSQKKKNTIYIKKK